MTRAYGAKSLRWNVTEKDVELAGDRLMATLGFTIWKLSQPRATMQTSGWPDRFYVHRDKRVAVFWEAKRPGGKQRESQRVFEADVSSCGFEYVWGTSDALVTWAKAKGLLL